MIRSKLENGDHLNEEDYLTLIVLPLMESKNSEEEQALKRRIWPGESMCRIKI